MKRAYIDRTGIADARDRCASVELRMSSTERTRQDDIDLIDTTTGCVLYTTEWNMRGLERTLEFARRHALVVAVFSVDVQDNDLQFTRSLDMRTLGKEVTNV